MRKIAVGDLGEFWYGDYKEPFVQLEGGVPGYPQGVLLKADDGKILCAWCGKTFDNLGYHVATTHGTPGPEYKESVGLLQKSALVSDKMRIAHSRQAKLTGFGVRPDDINRNRTKWAKGTDRATGDRSGQRKPEYLNKTGTCYEQALHAGRSIYRETGRLSERQLRKHGIHERVVRRYFGDMDGYRRAIGAAPLNFRRRSDAELISALRNLANDLGRTPTRSDIRRYGMPGTTTYVKRFGSYANACERAGLRPNVPTPDSNDLSQTILVTYATLGTITKTARHLHLDRARVEEVFARYGAPFVERHAIGGSSTEMRREWAADMARRLAGVPEQAVA